jgi:hypothetical protein
MSIANGTAFEVCEASSIANIEKAIRTRDAQQLLPTRAGSAGNGGAVQG